MATKSVATKTWEPRQLIAVGLIVVTIGAALFGIGVTEDEIAVPLGAVVLVAGSVMLAVGIVAKDVEIGVRQSTAADRPRAPAGDDRGQP